MKRIDRQLLCREVSRVWDEVLCDENPIESLNCLLVILSGVCFGSGRLRKEFGYVALLLYAAYVAASLMV